ncbi:MAG: beta-lactamase family protein [Micromonosporaceae bacterium]|nr:beta-lactamase family protein [Micromonosporaceae bacterium]
MTGSLTVDESHRGFTKHGLSRVDDMLRRGVDEGVYPGAVAAVALDGRLAYWYAAGVQHSEPEGAGAMPRDALFDLASVTKPVVGGSALMLLIEDGLLTLDDFVVDYVPEFRGHGKASVQIKHLVTHLSGIQSNPKLVHEHSGWESLQDAYLTLPLLSAPGAAYLYSSINFILLKLIVERVSGRPLDQLVADRVCTPLGLADTMFNPPPELRSRIPATEYNPAREDYDWGVVNDKTAQLLQGVSAHAGLFSTARDLAEYGDALLADARAGRGNFLSPAAARLLLRPELDQGSLRGGVCWRAGSTRTFGDLLGAESLGHTGTTGTAMCLVPAQRLTIVLLTNRTNPTRQNYRIEAFRPRFFNVVAAARCAD